jgi:hypothetical protein
MKHIVKLFALACLSAATAGAGLLQKSEVDADAKWLLHLDLDQFRSTKVGGYLISQIVEKQISKPLNDLKQQFKFEVDPNKILEKIGSITAYGTAYQSPKENAVLMIKTDPDLQAALVGVLAGMALAGTNSQMEMKQTQMGNVTLYSMKDKIHCAVLPGKLVALSLSRRAIEKAAEVLDKKAASLASSRTFSDFAEVKRSFFFLGVAEGFSANTELPPQAKLLQLADGGRIVLGENADQLFLDLALKAKTAEVVTQMQQVIQGLIAMASLGQSENKDLTQLVQSTKVSATDRVVSVSVEYPVDKAIQRIDEQKDKVGRRAGGEPRAADEGKAN